MAAKTLEEIAPLLEKISFKKKLFGGVDEDYVWHVLEQMQAEYRSVVEATEQRYGALLSEREELIRKQRKVLAQMEKQSSRPGGGNTDA